MQAIKDIALRMLNVYVSPYVENLNAQDLQLSVLSGKAEFNGLRLKKSVLERFGLPVEIVAGDIGKLSITIPWQAIKNQPAKIEIDDIYVLARARPQGKVDPEEDERIEQATKQEKLRSAEAVDSAASQVEEAHDSGDQQTYLGAIMAKIINNVQIHIKNIHLRYEDGTSTPEHPFAAGVTLSEFKMVSTDEYWLEAFISGTAKDVHKVTTLNALSIYFDTDASSLDRGPDKREDTMAAVKQMLLEKTDHQYILKPVSGEARLVIHRTMTNDTPKYDMQVFFDEIGVVLDRAQYRDTLSIVDVFHFYRRTHQYYKFRPAEEEYIANPAKARWKFALGAIKSEVHEKNRRWSWDYLAERRDKRKQYVELYVKKLALPEGGVLSPEDEAALDKLEKELPYEDIRFFRSVARVTARRDASTRKRLEAEEAKNKPHPQTWGQWLWGSGGDAKSDQKEGITEEDKKEIDDLIDYDAWSAAEPGSSAARDLMQMRISATLHKGSFSLRTDPHASNKDVIALVFDSFSADVLQLTDSMQGKIALGGFRVYDGTTPNSLYPQIVRVKDVDSNGTGSRSIASQPSMDAGTTLTLAETSSKIAPGSEPFFSLDFDHNPLDGRADNAVTVKMRHLEIIYHRNVVQEVVAFFKPPASQLESINALLDAAGETLDGIRKETRAGLEYALEQHKTLDLHVDMNAPIIIIPMDVTSKKSQMLVLDAGHIAIDSELADKDRVKDVQAKRGRQYNDEDYKQLEDLMYDRMLISLDSTQLLMSDDVDSAMKALDAHSHTDDTGGDLHLVERINMSFTVQNAIVNAPTLTKFKIAGNLPELQVNFSDRKYQTLMKFIDVAIPEFDDGEAEKDGTLTPIPSTPKAAGTFGRRGTIQEYNLDDRHDDSHRHDHDNRSVSSHAGDSSLDEKAGDQFFEANDDQTESMRRELQQVNFEFSFSVGKLQASLFRSTSATTERALAYASLEDFGLTFIQRKYEMSVDLFLRNITLAMIEQGNKAQRPLLSSGDTKGTTDHKLVKVRYLKVQKDSPDFHSRHDGFDTSIETDLSTFNITLAPEPILSLYDFIMTTFVSKDEEPAKTLEGSDAESSHAASVAAQQDASPDKMRIKVKLTSAHVSMENNGAQIALLSLPSADVVLVMRAGSMRVSARLGNILLEDTTDGRVAVPEFKKLLTIEGEELADFSYETYNPDEASFPGYNSSIHLRAGSLKFTFMEKPIHELYIWALKFARMKAVYDAASQAAAQRASEVTRMQYDVHIKTPIIVLPRDGLSSPDLLALRLGEIVAKNQYLNDSNDVSTIDASLRGINVASEMFHDDRKSVLQLVDDVLISASIKQAGGTEHRSDPHHADTEITTEMSDVKMSLTQRQYVLLMEVVEAIPRALAGLSEDDEESMPPTPLTEPPTPIDLTMASATDSGMNTPMTPVEETDLAPELKIPPGGDSVWTTLDFEFSVKSIGLEVYNADAITEEDLSKHSIARFSLIGSHLGLKSLSNSAMEAEFTLKTLAFSSTRAGNSVFRDIVPQLANEGDQIMVQYTKSADQSSLAIITIDSPRFILAVEPLAALLEFAVAPFKDKVSSVPVEDDDDVDLVDVQRPEGALSFRIDVVNSTVIVLADDSNPRTQAIQLSIKEILVSQNNVLALKVDKLAMSFGRMDKPEDRVSFLDDVNLTLSLDTSRKGSRQMTIIDLDVPVPVIFRASYGDMNLILDIVNKASAAAAKAMGSETSSSTPAPAKETRQITDGSTSIDTSGVPTLAPRPAPGGRRASGARHASGSRRRASSAAVTRVIVSKEHLQLRVNGFQFVLVGDVHEMPMVHLSTNEFLVTVNDWSGDLKMATSLTTSIRYFNLSNSYFEPLMDPWKFDLEVERVSTTPGQNPLSIKLSADQRLELSLTSAFIELGITSMTMWSKEGERVKDRGPAAPFRIRNRTGQEIAIWPESDDITVIPWHKRKVLEDGADIPWFFEDRQALRDNVSAFRHNSFGLELPDAAVKWEPVRGISVDQEGQHVLNLRPRIEKVTYQLMCDIELVDNIKVITIRSTLAVDNQTSLPVEMVVVDAHGKAAGGVMKIDPGQTYPVPFEAVYEKRFRLRPLRGFGFDYGWSTPLHWRQLIQRPIRPISCKHVTPKEPAFYFQAQANFDAKDPSARIYPRMSLTLRAPVELENLLPYDLKFRIHDKATSMSSSNFLVKGGTSPIHTVELSHLLLLSVAPEDTPFKQSEYAIINTDDPELPIENHFYLPDPKGLKVQLKLHYYTFPNSGGAFKVQVYSPFIFLNKTGLPFDLSLKAGLGGQKPVAGRDQFATDYQKDTPTPFIFSFPNDDRRNRLFLRVADSKLSQPLSFEPSAADMQIVMPSEKGDKDYYVGLSYAEGLGKYKLTKVITIAPRFLIKNTFSYAVQVRQNSDPKPLAVVKPGQRKPIRYLSNRDQLQLRLAFEEPDAVLNWSAPFNMNDIGRTNVTLTRQSSRGPKTYLMRVETHIEGSSIFMIISRETDPYPIKLRNTTSLPFKFKQRYNPDDGGDSKVFVERDLNPGETVDYTWDWPTASEKRIVLSTGNLVLPRPIDIMAIGVQPPIKIPVSWIYQTWLEEWEEWKGEVTPSRDVQDSLQEVQSEQEQDVESQVAESRAELSWGECFQSWTAEWYALPQDEDQLDETIDDRSLVPQSILQEDDCEDHKTAKQEQVIDATQSRSASQPAATISVDVRADGSSQLLLIAPYNEERSVFKPRRPGTPQTPSGSIGPSDSTDSLAATGFEAETINDKANLLVQVELEGIGVSVVTKKPDELLYMSLRGLKLCYNDYASIYSFAIDCKWIQIDNQLFGGLFPIILYPTVVPKDGKELESHPTLQATVSVLKDQTHGVVYVKYASVLLQAMTVELDEDFVMALIDFSKFKDATWREPQKDILIEYPKDIPEPDVTEAQSDVFFESLQLQPVSLELSFMRTDRVNVEEKVSTRNPFYYALNALTMTIGNVNAAPVNFRALFLDNVRLSSHDLQERIILHYQEQAVAQIYRVLGSADFLGNPVGLFNNISSGFSDFFYEPWQGFVMHGNRDIGLGIARGATSLARKTVFGITDSMTKFTSSIGKGLSAATLDADYQTKRRMTQKRNKPKHALYGVAAGASAFADSVTSAFEGVASMPMEGAEKGGAAGFAKGVGKGFVGLFTKPVVGIMDFVSASTEGIRNTTTVFDSNDIDRVRLPRFIASDGVLRPYSARDALGQSWLKDLDAGAYFNETYVAHLDIPGDDAVAILSNSRLLFVQLRKMRVIWQVPFDELQSLSLESSGIALTLRGGTPGPFLPIGEQTGREWLFRKIAKVVETYNKSHSQRDE